MMHELKPSEVVKIITRDPGARRDIPFYVTRDPNAHLVSQSIDEPVYAFWVQRI